MPLLTLEEYKSIARDLVLPTGAYINGAFRPAQSGNTFVTANPATGQPLANIAACDAQDVDSAVHHARRSFDQGVWAARDPAERKEVLIRLVKLMTRDQHRLAVMESLDSGKTIYDCQTVDVPEAINCLKWHAETCDKIYDQTAPASEDHMAIIIREPIGVVGLVLPWNFPLLMLAWKIAPALAAGCSVVVKPAEETSLTALYVAELASEAGLPAGVLNVLPGGGEAVGEPIGRHADVDMVSFTGSTATGKRFLTYAAESNAKEVVLEMGGKNPAIVMDDAPNLDVVAQHIVNGAFWNMGENCSAVSRLLVHHAVRDALLQRVEHHMQQWNLGDPLDPLTRVGALVSPDHYAKVKGYLDQATIVIGGRVETHAIAPTVIAVENNSDALAQEEIFGPVLSVITIGSIEEGISLANQTTYGLCASVFTTNIKQALQAARRVKAGTVTVNCFGEGNISTPFGGYKQSGFGGRDNGIHAHDQYTQLKTIWIDLADDHDESIA
ncbi:MAG: aldehyde dehydrogenase [Alphaproteobacteria bacterium]|nr:aldehyde dehydrogenase [Alphaproteobacteria bacterium]